MAFTFLAVAMYLAIAVIAIIILGSLITFIIERSPYQPAFVAGRAPDPGPDGFHPGEAHVLFDKKTPWLGKQFDRQAQIGFNIFTPLGARILKVASPLYQKFSVNEEGNTRAYYFKTYIGKGRKDVNTDVFKLDYDMPENPFWIRAILDEVVEIAPREYLGKIHVKFLPGFFVTIGYFGLREQTASEAAFDAAPATS
ncbi:MAG: hypothetical protein JMDDDDMK_04220 [Acidobacteria bacterium]|nr:hypothetical protein [Acidobacteriota bacterium]